MTEEACRAKKVLQKYEALDKEIKAKQDCVQHWFELATRATPSLEAERVSGTGDRSRVEAAMIRKIDMEAIIDKKIDQLRKMRFDILNAIDAMDDPMERTILHYRYIAGKSWAYTNAKMEIKERTSFRLHESALIHFGEIYF